MFESPLAHQILYYNIAVRLNGNITFFGGFIYVIIYYEICILNQEGLVMTDLSKEPLRPPITTSEFGWDVQLTYVEFATIRDACKTVFESVILRERDPYKRTILLGRIPQDAAVVTANIALKYCFDKLIERTTNGE